MSRGSRSESSAGVRSTTWLLTLRRTASTDGSLGAAGVAISGRKSMRWTTGPYLTAIFTVRLRAVSGFGTFTRRTPSM